MKNPIDRLRQILQSTLGRWQRALSRFLSGMRYRLRESGWARLPSLERLRTAELPRLRRQARTRTDRNIWHLYVETFWAGIFMAAIAFNATYALRLGASNTQIGWLSSIPSLLAMVVLVPAARFLERQSDRAPYIRRSLFIGRAAFVGAAIAPWILPRHAAEVVIAVLILRSIPMQFYSAGFTPLLADIIPVRDRALVIANRSIIQGATTAISTYLFGKWMDAAAQIPWARFPVNYQIVYLIGTVAGVLSAYFVSRIEVPKTPVIEHPRPRLQMPKLRELREKLVRLAHENQGFVRITINTFVFNIGAWLVGPLYMIFFVRQLNASDSWVGLNTTVAQVGVIVGYLLWRAVMEQRGTDWTLRFTVPMAASYAFLVALFPNLSLILVWGIVINVINSGVNLAHGTMLYDLCPPEQRATYLAIYATLSNVGAFAAPMLGVALSEWIDIRWILIAGGAIRLIGAGLFHLYPVKAAGDTHDA
ncbi:MAG: MFS transporter [Anaerolineae bacterium]